MLAGTGCLGLAWQPRRGCCMLRSTTQLLYSLPDIYCLPQALSHCTPQCRVPTAHTLAGKQQQQQQAQQTSASRKKGSRAWIESNMMH